MKNKRTIRRVIILSAWLIVVAGIATLLIAANKKQKEHVCKEVQVSIKGTGEKFYIEKNDVLRSITKTYGGTLLQRNISSIDLSKLEKALEGNAWIRNAELYFDNQDVLHVTVEEREPIVRIFTKDGNSFYIDSSGQRMPLLEKVSARLPVVTGFTSARKWSNADSSLVEQIKQVVLFISNNEFWNAQIGQININEQNKFDLVPTIGDHVIRIGDAENIEGKLKRLYVFYKQVMSKVGFDKYRVLDVEFDGQVVAVNKGAASAVDSVQLQKNIEELFRKNTLQDTDEEPKVSANSSGIHADTSFHMTAPASVPVAVRPNPAPVKAGRSKPSRNITTSKPVEKPKKMNPGHNKPKAVMPARNRRTGH